MNKENQIKSVVDQLFRQGNFDCIDLAFSVGYVAHVGEKSYSGHNFIRQFAKQLRTAIPDIKIVKIEVLSQTEDMLTWQRTYSGTHKASLKGIPASLKKVKWSEMVVSRFDSDMIVEEWVASDLAFQLMLKQKPKE